MSVFSRLFGAKYDDDRLAMQAQTAIAEDPLISDHSGLAVTSSKGVVMVSGVVHRETDRERVEGVVRSSLDTLGLKYDRLINDLSVG